MGKNYKLHKKVTGAGDRCRWRKERGIPGYNVRNYNQKTKGGHGLHKGFPRLQTMTAFNEMLLRGVQGGGFLEKSPPGRRRQN